MSRHAVALTVALFAAVIGVWALTTVAEDPKPGKTAMVSLPADELAKAIQDIKEAKMTVAPKESITDLKSSLEPSPVELQKRVDTAVAKLDAALKILEAAKAAATQPAATPTAVPAAAGDTFTGPVHATGSRKLPRITLDGTKYDLKASDKADAAAKETLTKISNGETGDFVVKGKKDGNVILVDSITKK